MSSSANIESHIASHRNYLQAEKLKHTTVKLVVITGTILAAWKVVVHPADQCRLLIVEKDTAVFNGRLSSDGHGVQHNT